RVVICPRTFQIKNLKKIGKDMEEIEQYIYCRVVSGGRLTPDGLTTLFRIAREMWKARKIKHPIKAETFEGLVSTNNRLDMVIGSKLGVEFTAEIESDEGRFSTKFVVRMEQLDTPVEDRSFWIPGLPDVPLFVSPANN
ncbi:MAG: hypothetical protein COV91_00560, partial [Candidatus Taylorbacteria bacterium CG11_big_fil_rev_8_21_14_0_20_46_11]